LSHAGHLLQGVEGNAEGVEEHLHRRHESNLLLDTLHRVRSALEKMEDSFQSPRQHHPTSSLHRQSLLPMSDLPARSFSAAATYDDDDDSEFTYPSTRMKNDDSSNSSHPPGSASLSPHHDLIEQISWASTSECSNSDQEDLPNPRVATGRSTNTHPHDLFQTSDSDEDPLSSSSSSTERGRGRLEESEDEDEDEDEDELQRKRREDRSESVSSWSRPSQSRIAFHDPEPEQTEEEEGSSLHSAQHSVHFQIRPRSVMDGGVVGDDEHEVDDVVDHDDNPWENASRDGPTSHGRVLSPSPSLQHMQRHADERDRPRAPTPSSGKKHRGLEHHGIGIDRDRETERQRQREREREREREDVLLEEEEEAEEVEERHASVASAASAQHHHSHSQHCPTDCQEHRPRSPTPQSGRPLPLPRRAHSVATEHHHYSSHSPHSSSSRPPKEDEEDDGDDTLEREGEDTLWQGASDSAQSRHASRGHLHRPSQNQMDGGSGGSDMTKTAATLWDANWRDRVDAQQRRVVWQLRHARLALLDIPEFVTSNSNSNSNRNSDSLDDSTSNYANLHPTLAPGHAPHRVDDSAATPMHTSMDHRLCRQPPSPGTSEDDNALSSSSSSSAPPFMQMHQHRMLRRVEQGHEQGENDVAIDSPSQRIRVLAQRVADRLDQVDQRWHPR
jgi:hypothetical protein